MRSQAETARKYEDPVSKQTIAVEPMLATRAEDAQKDLDKQAEATQNRFQ